MATFGGQKGSGPHSFRSVVGIDAKDIRWRHIEATSGQLLEEALEKWSTGQAMPDGRTTGQEENKVAFVLPMADLSVLIAFTEG